MRHFFLVLGVLGCLVSLGLASDPVPQEKAVASKVYSVALFKNGLAVVKRQVMLDGPGVYRLDDVPEPVHGTFWIESQDALETRVETREVSSDTAKPLGVSLQDELAGMKVVVHGRNNKTTMTGTVMAAPKKEAPELPATHMYDEYAAYRPVMPTGEPASRFLILKTDRGVSYIDFGDIAALEAEGTPPERKSTQKKPVLLVHAGKDAKAGMVQVSYLVHGLSWAPSYRVDLTDAKKLSIEQQAVIRNELVDLKETEVSLISGYPSVQFGHVVSPLAAQQTWQRFFQQLNQRGGQEIFSNAVISQQAYARSSSPPAHIVAPNTGDTIDLNFHPIGKRDVKKGSALALSTGTGTAEYERIVEWTIPDNRDEWGSPREGRRDPNSGEPLQDDVWDALKFKNPLPFPMTSAPAMVMTNGKFNGQRQTLWTNQGEEAMLRINKALSVRTRCSEYEEHKGNGTSDRDIIWLGGRRFRKGIVKGELKLCNHRQAEIKLVIKRHFSGDLIKADAEPKIELREEGVWAVNRRNELVWTLHLKPNEERTIGYQYSVLVNF